MSEIHDDDLIDTAGLAKSTKTSKITWVRRRMRGEGPPYIAIGRAIRYPRAQTLAWLAEHGARRRA